VSEQGLTSPPTQFYRSKAR